MRDFGNLNDDPHDDVNYESAGSESPAGDIRNGVGQIFRDVVTLTELQAELLRVDLRNWTRDVLVPTAILAAVAGFATLASLPVLLLSLAYYLVEVANLTVPSALFTAAGVGLVIALLCGGLAWRAVAARRPSAFARSGVELAQNLHWLKSVLVRPSTTADQLDSLTPAAARRTPR